MAKNQESINSNLFDLLRSRGYNPTMLDTSGKEIPIPEEAEVFQFKFTKDGEEYGTVTLSIDGLHKLVVYFGDDVANSAKTTSGSDDSWYQLLNHLKRFAKAHQLSFEIKNVDHLKYDMAKRDHMKKQEQIAESYYPMGKKASYSDAVPSVKMVIQHTREMMEGEQRFRNVARIFLENSQGERILAPTTRPGIATIYARHLAEGGLPHDERWNHINGLCEEYQKMAGFVRATRNGQFNESAQQLVSEGVNHYNNLRETLSKMRGHKGYNAYFESWTPALMEDDSDVSSINELFVQGHVDPRIESAMPILSKLHKKVSEMKEVDELAEWADSLLEGDGGQEALNAQGIPEGLLQLEESHMSEVDMIIHDIIDGELDAYTVMNHPKTPEEEYVARLLLDQYEEVARNHRLHPDDNFEEILDIVVDNMAKDYASPEVDEGMVGQALGTVAGAALGKTPMAATIGGQVGSALQDKLTGEEVDEGLGDVAKKVGSALKTGAKAVGKAIVGPDDDELLQRLKRDAGVRNPQTGKPSMAMSKVDEVDLGQYDAVKAPLKGKDTSDWDKNFREKLKQYTKELDQRQKEKKEKSEKVDEQGVAEAFGLYGPFTVTINTGERPQSRTKTKKFRREDDAILWAQDWLEDFSQYPFATAEVTDPDGNVVWTTDEEDSPWAPAKEGVAEGSSDRRKQEQEADKWLEKRIMKCTCPTSARNNPKCPVHGKKKGVAEAIRNTDDPFDDMVEDYLDYLESVGELRKSREEEKADLIADLEAGHIHPSEIEYALSGTEWDPLAEDLDANQKRVGQLGPTEKVGKKGPVGKLVGASESVEVKEGQEDLDAILRIIKK